MKKIISLLLAVIMVVSLFPVMAFADDGYAITDGTAQDANGTISIDKETAAEGETVTITINPATGYQLKAGTLEVTYTDGTEKTCQLTQDSTDTAKYTFTMPGYAVTVTAVFEEVGGTGSVTAAEGEDSNGYYPVYGLYMDAFVRTQMLYPCSMLTELQGKAITQLTFYSKSISCSWGGKSFKVYAQQVTDAIEMGTLHSTDDATLIYEGPLSVADSKMLIPLTAPLNYSGGDLLLTFYNVEKGSYHSCSFIGSQQESATAQYSSSYSNLPTSGNANNTASFLPKVTFDFAVASMVSYTVTDGTAQDANGSISFDKTSAAEGETVTITVNPATGYQLKAGTLEVTYTDGTEKTCQLTQDSTDTTKYTFTMPGYAVTVTAEFEKIPHTHNPVKVNGQAATESASGFKDYYECKDSDDACHKYFEDATGLIPIENLDAWKSSTGNGYLAPLVHTVTPVNGQDATDTEAGYKPYYECKNCGKYYEDATGLIEITDIDAWKSQTGKGYLPKLKRYSDTITIGGNKDKAETKAEEAKEENPNTGAPVMDLGAVAVVLGAAYVVFKKH